MSPQYITLLICIIYVWPSMLDPLIYVETNQLSLKYVTESRCYLRKINKMQAGDYTKMKDYAILNYL